MRKKIIIPAVLLAAMAGGGGLTYFGHIRALEKSAAAPRPQALVPIVAGVVAQHDVPIYLTGVGTVIAYNTDIVRTQIQGQIVSINFTEGQTVHAGDLLAQIDPRPYQAQIDQYTANRDRDQAQLVNAQANLTRYSALGEQGLGHATTDRDPEGAGCAVAEAIQVRPGADRRCECPAQLYATDVADRWRHRHPSDRRGQHHPSRPTRNGLVVVTQLDPISLIFTLPETDLPQIQQQQQETKAPLTVLAYSQDDKIKLDQGKLGLVNNEILQTTGSIQLKANFPNKDSIGCGPANSSTRGCWSIRGMTA